MTGPTTAAFMTSLDQLARRMVTDAFLEATRAYWERRAEQLEAARHDPARDYPGQATAEQLRARWVALTDAAAACRRRAEMTVADHVDELVASVLVETDPVGVGT